MPNICFDFVLLETLKIDTRPAVEFRIDKINIAKVIFRVGGLVFEKQTTIRLNSVNEKATFYKFSPGEIFINLKS